MLTSMSLIARIWDRYGMLVRYGISGATGAVIQIATLAFWVEVVHAGNEDEYQGGIVVGFLIALAVTFLLQKYWTFKDASSERVKRQFVLYTIFALGNLAGNSGLMYVLVDVFGFWYLGANVFTVGCVAVLSFLANRYLTFRSALVPDPALAPATSAPDNGSHGK